MMTKEEILEAAKHCVETGGICENCPFRINKTNCELSFANYIKENESKPVIKNISSAESNTNTIYENAKITDVSLEIGDHCCLTFSIPPFLLGLNWSTTERMSAQQSDILTSELEYYRRLLEPILREICEAFLRLNGYACGVEIEWDNINLQDEEALAKSRLYNAQAKTAELENERVENERKKEEMQ